MPDLALADLAVHYLDRGTGAATVFLHGNWATSSWWEPVLDLLPPGRRGIAPDLRGRGRTRFLAGLDQPDHSIARLAADQLALIDALGLEAVDLVGHSLGTAVALELALGQGGRVRSLCLVAPAWIDGMPAWLADPAPQRALASDRGLLGRALRAIAPGAPDGPAWERLVAESAAQDLGATLGTIDALLAWHPGAALAAIRCPTLVVVGADDQLTGGANAQRAAAVLGARCVVLPGIGHSPPIEDPTTLAATIWAHLDGAPAGGS